MLHRMFLSFSLVLGLGLAGAACVEPAPSDEPPTDQVELAPGVAVDTDVALDVVDGEAVNAPDALCGRTFCGPRPPWTICYCNAGSGLYASSTCSQGCRWDPTGVDPTD